jgi:hypothetical protein
VQFKTLMLIAFLAAAAAPGVALAQAAPPATVDDLAERKALAHQLMDEVNFKELMTSFLGSMDAGEAAMASTPDGDRVRQSKASSRTAMVAILPDLEAVGEDTYASVFTTRELRAIVAFYASPEGQAMLHKMPGMTKQMMPGLYRVMPKWVDAYQKDYCAHRPCSADKIRSFDALRASFLRAAAKL